MALNHREYLGRLGIDVENIFDRINLDLITRPTLGLRDRRLPANDDRFSVGDFIVDDLQGDDTEPVYATVLNLEDVFDENSLDFQQLVGGEPSFAQLADVFADFADLQNDNEFRFPSRFQRPSSTADFRGNNPAQRSSIRALGKCSYRPLSAYPILPGLVCSLNGEAAHKLRSMYSHKSMQKL